MQGCPSSVSTDASCTTKCTAALFCCFQYMVGFTRGGCVPKAIFVFFGKSCHWTRKQNFFFCRQIQDLHASFGSKRVEEPVFSLRAIFIQRDYQNCSGLPRGSKLSLISLYRQRFLRHGLIFEIAIFGHETWNLKKVLEVEYGPSFYPGGSKLSLFLLYRHSFRDTGRFQNCHILAWNLEFEKSAGSWIYRPFFYHKGSKINSFSLCRQPFMR